ncbi:SapC family protein [Sphingomonas arantia]|uniref:SapC family protein n=1 Tax=Sphingomonas arantia TaxID=1460676 RepID=A0ABW4TWM0_9SPHN
MASAAPANDLPLFYNQLEPLSSQTHGSWKARNMDAPTFLVGTHAVPLTVEEFAPASRFYPIVFSLGDQPVPLALMALNEGVNTFVGPDGRFTNDAYIPAYIRRYPFMLARLNPNAEELSLCFDPSSGTIGEFEEGDALFADGKPTEVVGNILAFCEQFEQAGQRTSQFMKELADHKLLMDGEVTIQPEGADQPFIYRGFQMVNEDALKEMRGDTARKLIKSGVLPLIYAHLFSLALIRDIFARQMEQGKIPAQPLRVDA